MADTPAWLASFPALEAVSDPFVRTRLAMAQVMQLPPGVTVFRDGDVCRNYLLVLDGSVRVQKLSESGKEIVLYRVESGQSCVLTTSCLLSGEHYLAEAVTETDVRAVALPMAAFHEALGASRPFRDFVFRSFGERISGLILLVEAVAFGRMDTRLAQRLLERADGSGALVATHQELAAELGTAREVISRLLKEFERRGWVRLGRGRVTLDDRNALQELAGNGAV